MDGGRIGIIVIIILLVPVFFQVVTAGLRAEKRHKDILESLKKIEEKLSK